MTQSTTTTKVIAYLALMGKIWWDVYWLYTAEILPCYNGSGLYTPLYVVVLYMCKHVKVTFDISGSPLESLWGTRKYPAYNGDVGVHVCVCVCVRFREYPFLWYQHYDYWRTVAYLASRPFATTLLTQQWRLQSYQVKRMIFLSKAGASIL